MGLPPLPSAAAAWLASHALARADAAHARIDRLQLLLLATTLAALGTATATLLLVIVNATP